jgi:fructose-1,6-bisphosphatase I
LASKIIAAAIRRAGLVNILGSAKATNVQGEEQQKLDVFANETIKNALMHTGRVCVMGSEEDDDIIPVPAPVPRSANTRCSLIRSTGRPTST